MRFSYIIGLVCIVHVVQGISIILDGAALSITSLAHMPLVDPRFHIPLGLGLILFTLMAMLGMVCGKDRNAVWLFVPQWIMLLMSAFGPLVAIANSHYADGVIRPFQFILADQIIYPVVTILYSIQIFEGLKSRITR